MGKSPDTVWVLLITKKGGKIDLRAFSNKENATDYVSSYVDEQISLMDARGKIPRGKGHIFQALLRYQEAGEWELLLDTWFGEMVKDSYVLREAPLDEYYGGE